MRNLEITVPDARPRMAPCCFCPSSVGLDPVEAARHLLFACRNPSQAALEVARRVLSAVPA